MLVLMVKVNVKCKLGIAPSHSPCIHIVTIHTGHTILTNMSICIHEMYTYVEN